MPRLVPALSFLVILVSLLLYRVQPQLLRIPLDSLVTLGHETFDKFYDSQPPQQVITTPATTGFTSRIVAVGDLHGDLPNALRVLKMSGVIDDSGDWSGDVDILAQTGDIIDRGDDTIALYALMDKLREQAEAAGGVVLSVLGNHEWMNAIGDWRYVYPTEITTFGSIEKRQEAISSGAIGRSWAHNYTTAARLPYHRVLGQPNAEYDGSQQTSTSHAALSFVHGGLSPTYENLAPYPTKINQVAASLLRKLQNREQPLPHPPHPYPGLPPSTTPEEMKLYDSNGPLWYRGWAMENDKTVCAAVDGVLKKIGSRRMIMGHTPDFTGIVSRCDGKIIIIDTGISHAYGGVLAALSIDYSLKPLGENLWEEKEVVKALYVDKPSQIIVDEVKELAADLNLPPLATV